MTARIDQRTIDDVRSRVSIEALVGRRVKLRRAGQGWNGLCPFHEEKTPSFTVSNARGSFHCFGCGAHGDAFEWVVRVDGCSFREAVETLAASVGVDIGAVPVRESAALDGRVASSVAMLPAREAQPSDVVSSTAAGRWIFSTAGPARGELVERWLEARGLDPAAQFLPGVPAIDQLLFHPRCPVSSWRVHDDPGCARLTAPAMVAPIRDDDGLVWGVHVTFLSADGRSKARLPLAGGRERPTRKMFGKVAGNAVWLSGDGPAGQKGGNAPPVVIESEGCAIDDEVSEYQGVKFPLIVGEGIETCWAFAQSLGRPFQVAATLSLQNLQGSAVKLRDGSLPLWNLRSDPHGWEMFTVPGAGEVVVLVDADMKPLRNQRLQLARGAKPVVGGIDGLKRAEICAALATQAWRRAGATKVSAVRPRMGLDFNDSIRSAA